MVALSWFAQDAVGIESNSYRLSVANRMVSYHEPGSTQSSMTCVLLAHSRRLIVHHVSCAMLSFTPCSQKQNTDHVDLAYPCSLLLL